MAAHLEYNPGTRKHEMAVSLRRNAGLHGEQRFEVASTFKAEGGTAKIHFHDDGSTYCGRPECALSATPNDSIPLLHVTGDATSFAITNVKAVRKDSA